MLYEVITDPCAMVSELKTSQKQLLEISRALHANRITSYNVCYTKLLRDGNIGSGACFIILRALNQRGLRLQLGDGVRGRNRVQRDYASYNFV